MARQKNNMKMIQRASASDTYHREKRSRAITIWWTELELIEYITFIEWWGSVFWEKNWYKFEWKTRDKVLTDLNDYLDYIRTWLLKKWQKYLLFVPTDEKSNI